MDRNEFDSLLRDLAAHLYDLAALENHVLGQYAPPIAGASGGESLQRLVLANIDALQPQGKSLALGAAEWRPYLILHKRYVQGASLGEIAEQLALSERQLRRDHSRALMALAGRLWHSHFQRATQVEPGPPPAGADEPAAAYALHLEPLNLAEVLRGVAEMMQRRFQEDGIEVQLALPERGGPRALTDRSLLRQVLVSLFNYAVHLEGGGAIHAGVNSDPRQAAAVWLQADCAVQWEETRPSLRQDFIAPLDGWLHRLETRLEESYPPHAQAGSFKLQLSFPGSSAALVLVVDDQEATQRMYQRYLSRLPLRVIGVSDPSQALNLARQLKPVLITLDVMMPRVDGWEILQGLQADELTRHIPVVVCSAWEETELARSLGAAGFLKKPITQKVLLEELGRLNILGQAPGVQAGGSGAGRT